jgi:5-methylcytosine-specific restriction endonuclease McrA
LCGAYGCGKNNPLEVDHIISRGKGGDDSLDNLRSLCFTCHRARHVRVGGSKRSAAAPAEREEAKR